MKVKVTTAITRFVHTAFGRVQYLVFTPRRRSNRAKRLSLRTRHLAGAPGK
jgi:hypothetical protein